MKIDDMLRLLELAKTGIGTPDGEAVPCLMEMLAIVEKSISAERNRMAAKGGERLMFQRASSDADKPLPEVVAWRHGSFCVHKGGLSGRSWAVSHVATGRSLTQGIRTKGAASKLAKAASAIVPRGASLKEMAEYRDELLPLIREASKA